MMGLTEIHSKVHSGEPAATRHLFVFLLFRFLSPYPLTCIPVMERVTRPTVNEEKRCIHLGP